MTLCIAPGLSGLSGMSGIVSQSSQWSPLSLSPVLWLNPTGLPTTTNGGAVTTWTDASGNGNNWSQATNPPTLATAANTGLNFNTVSFNGSNQTIVSNNSFMSTATAATSYLVLKNACHINYAYYNGYIGEHIVYTYALNSTQDAQVRAYLKAKWSTP